MEIQLADTRPVIIAKDSTFSARQIIAQECASLTRHEHGDYSEGCAQLLGVPLVASRGTIASSKGCWGYQDCSCCHLSLPD